MKKFFSFCMLLLLAMPASAWVFLADTQKKVPGVLLPKIINQQGQNIRVCMDVLDDNDRSMYNNPAQRTLALTHYNAVKPFLAPAYKTWFDTLRSTIINSGRQTEFADVLALLPKQDVSFVFINPEASPCIDDSKQDLYIRLDPILLDEHEAYMRVHNNFSSMTLFQNSHKIPDLLKLTILHESGHTLGLGDMYGEKENASYNSKFYSMASIQKLSTISSCMNKNCSGDIEKRTVIETSQRLGEKDSWRSLEKEVILFHPYSNESLTCDDMDGLVNVLDFYFPEKMSARRTQGWLSFCPNKNVAYVASLPVVLTEQDKADFSQFIAQGRQGSFPIVQKLQAARQRAEHTERLAAQAREQQRMQEQQKQVQDSLAAAIANQQKEQEYQAKLNQYQSRPQVPNECPVCHKPLLSGYVSYNAVRLCDRDENGHIRLGCIFIHQGCKGDLKYKSKLQEFIKSLDPKFITPTADARIQQD